ncbi:Cochaperone protein [Entomophthora muscae]|uniref:Cochaperone protein n=1 Tax=Entomophthora muscae TaxID=34485 RepID=A0ACC2T0U3_9FUNG|nr:Cochaperone protein [Entomophthora muscae]
MSELYQEANDLFIDEEYSQALTCYDKLIAGVQEGSTVTPALLAEYYYKRGLTHQKLDQLQLASADCTKCIEWLEKSEGSSKLLVKAAYRMGLCEFKLNNYNVAQEALLKAEKLGSVEKDLASMLETCKAKLPKSQEPSTSQIETTQASPAKIRHEWYQTDSHVYVSVFIKKVQPANLTVELLPREVSLSVKQTSGTDIQFSLEPLAQEIDVSQSAYTVLSTKVEFSLKKANLGFKWSNLEGDEDTTSSSKVASVPNFKPSYPSSSRKPKNWDALSREAEKEAEAEENSGMNAVFQKIYRDADENTRRAMLKSFTESNGTCLSTDWKDVGSKRVETSPPEGMEARKWGQ